jgi:pyruvate/2-oxoglutarate dehydrogenase complex dihydrolipoamide acyltransferase (E2) component
VTERHTEALERLNQGIQESRREVQQRTMGLAQDYFGESAEALKQQIKEDRATLESLPDQVPGGREEAFQALFQELIENYSAVEESIDEAQKNVANIDTEQIRRQGEVEATDAARREARERGVDLTKIEGTGSDGRIIVSDVVEAAEAMEEEDGAASQAAQQAQDAAGQATDQAQQIAGQATDQAGQVAGQVQDTVGGAAGQAQQVAGQATDQAGQVAGQAQEAAGGAVQQAQDTVGGLTGGLTGGQQDDGEEQGGGGPLGGVTDQVGQVAQGVQDTAGGAAQQVQDTAGQATEQAGQVAGQAQQVASQATDQAGQVAGQAQDAAGQAAGQAQQAAGGDGAEEPRATNAARRRAEQLGLDLSTIQGTGSGGLITIRDVTGS